MTWKVNYTEDAEQDLQDIYEYISDFLLEPVIAEKQANRIMDTVDSLDHMPLRYRLYVGIKHERVSIHSREMSGL